MEEPNFNQGATPPNSEPVKKSSDWKVVLVIVFIAFLSTVAYGVYYFFTNQDVAQVDPMPTAINTPIESSMVKPAITTSAMLGWKIYRNEQRGFEVQYLENWQYLESQNSIMFLNDLEYYEYGGAAFPGHYPDDFVSIVKRQTSEELIDYINKDLENRVVEYRRDILISGELG